MNKIIYCTLILLIIGCTQNNFRNNVQQAINKALINNKCDNPDLLAKAIKTQDNTLLNNLIKKNDIKSNNFQKINHSFYKGAYLNDVRDMRYALSNINLLKKAGFNTVLIETQFQRVNNTLYIPGVNVYLFYIKAFHASGFNVWLTLGHTSYELTKNNQQPTLKEATPFIINWSLIAQQLNVEAFIISEEANQLVFNRKGNPNLNKSERNELSKWMQELIPIIRKNYSRLIGIATNDGGTKEVIGPDLNYSNYDLFLDKIPFINSFNNDDEWLYEVNNRLINDDYYSRRNNLKGFIWYEAGAPVGKSLIINESSMNRVINESEQAITYELIFNQSMISSELKGLFFKISRQQVHEGDWSPFNKPAMSVLQQHFNQSIKEQPLDELWIKLGIEGLKIIELCLSDEMPFDPEYSLDKEYFNNSYHKLELRIKGYCNSYDC